VKLWFGNASTTTIGGYTYRLEDLGVDDHGDTAATATAITASTTSSTGRVETFGDVDYFSFAGTANTTCEFSCSSAAIDSYLVRVAGTFYVRVYSGTATLGAYTYQLKNLGMDDHGNTLSDATPMAEAGHIYEVSCSTSAFNCDLVLMDAAGTTVASDTFTSTSALVRVELNTGGVKLISGSGAYGSYSYRLNDRGVDQHSDTFAGATVLTLGTATAGNIEIAGDLDFFAVNLVSGTSYTVTPTGITVSILVYAPNQSTLLYNGAGPGTFTATGGTATYYVRVTGASSGTGAYTVRVQ